MRTLFHLFAFLFIPYLAIGQINFAVDQIPKELLLHAGAVVRMDETVIEIKDKDNVTYHYKTATTILNTTGDRYASKLIFHNKLWSIKSVKGAIYNEYGNLVSKISASDFDDNYYEDGFSLFQDARYKSYHPRLTVYPYTVEYEYELNSKQNLDIQAWYGRGGSNVAVENSSCLLLYKPGMEVNYKQINYPGVAKKGTTNGVNSLYWQISNQKAIRQEMYTVPEKNLITHVEFAPQGFIYDGITGSFKNWDDLGRWTYYKLLEGRDKLPPQTTEEIKNLVKDLPSAKEKAKKIYEYMQQKCRYVSIQIGIGGYRPFMATDVDALGYGDCKALVNYTHALLKIANIDSYYCVVEAGSEKINAMPDFASIGQFNHAILCLPFKNDTTWLECTSKQIPFGFLGNFTDDREVLACTPSGGKLMHTPKYTATQNRDDKIADFKLLEDGTIMGIMNSTFTGTQYEYRDDFLNESSQDRVKNIVKRYLINNMEVENLQFEPDRKEMPTIKETIKFKASEYAAADNGKLVFTANATNRVTHPLQETHNRISPLYINRGFTDDEKITYTLPAGYTPDNAPLNIGLHKKFGNYKASVSISGNQLIYTRRFQLLDGTYTKEDYDDFVDFYQSVYDADHYTVTLVKK